MMSFLAIDNDDNVDGDGFEDEVWLATALGYCRVGKTNTLFCLVLPWFNLSSSFCGEILRMSEPRSC